MLPAQMLQMVARDLRSTTFHPQQVDPLLGKYDLTIREQLRPLLSQMLKEGATPRLMALMLEQLANSQARWERERKALNFIWSGPEPAQSPLQDTFATVTKLVREAKTNLLISTYNIGTTADIRTLFSLIASNLEAGKLERFDLFFHPKQIEKELNTSSDRQARIEDWFYRKIWTPNSPIHAYVDARLLEPGKITTYQHAKAVVANADTPEGQAFVTSANLSGAGQRRNFEAGWLVKSASRARNLRNHFRQMVEEGFYIQIQPPH